MKLKNKLLVIGLCIAGLSTPTFAKINDKVILTQKDEYIEVEMKNRPTPQQDPTKAAQAYDEFDDEVESYSPNQSGVTVGGNGPGHIQVEIDKGHSSSGGSEAVVDCDDCKESETGACDKHKEEADKECEACASADGFCEEHDDNESSSGSSSSESWNDYEDINISIPDPIARIAVTELSSINNELSNAYFKPDLKSLPHLKSIVEQYGKFNYAGTTRYDLGKGASNNSIKENGRAIEILGQDFLLTNEDYIQEFGKWRYVTEKAGTLVSYSQAVMNIYKSLDMPLYKYTFVYEPLHLDEMSTNTQTQIAKVYQEKNVDTARGKTKVFVTRTNIENYLEKAINDNLVSAFGTDWDRSISGKEFIVMVHQFMDMYGESQMSQMEEYMLLQLFGQDIPPYLSIREKEAYVYLKARGILVSNIDFNKPLRLDDMLDILMRVKDEGSRHTFKNIQPTVDIGSDLIAKGYYPIQLGIAQQGSSLQTKSSYDYSKATMLDYYVIVDESTKIVDTSGQQVNDLYIPMSDTYISPPVPKSSYEGVVDGTLYHFRVPVEFNLGGYIIVNSRDGEDTPRYLKLPYGGGIYMQPKVHPNGYVELVRAPFKDGMYEGSVDVDRMSKKVARITSFVEFALNLFSTPIYAATPNGVPVTVTVYGLGNISNVDELLKAFPGAKVDTQADSITMTSYDSKETIMSKVKMKNVAGGNTVLREHAISSIGGSNVLISYKTMQSMGLFYGVEPEVADRVMKIKSKYGDIILDNNKHTVTVGNTVYVVPDNHVLFTPKVDDSGTDYMVDFRAAYGWSLNDVTMEISGTGNSTMVNIEESKNTYDVFKTMQIMQVWGNQDRIPVLTQKDPKGNIQVVLSSSYPLANYFIHRADKNGPQTDYMYVVYLKQAFSDYSIEHTNALDSMKKNLGVSIDNENWTIREVKLDMMSPSKTGSVSLVPNVGYVYTLPTTEEFDMVKYLKGEYLLPLSYDSTNGLIRDHNVNYYKNTPYGKYIQKVYRPDSNNGDVNVTEVDYKGYVKHIKTEVDDGTYKITEIENIVPAPTGIMSYLPYYKRQYVMLKDVGKYDTSRFYYGTIPIIITGEEDGRIKCRIGSGDADSYFFAQPDTKIFRVGSMAGSDIYSMSALGEVTVGNDSQEQDELILNSVNGNKEDDRFRDFNIFSLSFWINFVDWLLSAILMFTIYVLPYIGFTCLIILVGLSMMADNKMVQAFFEKTIDPVKIITIGLFEFSQLEVKATFYSSLIGAFLFALLLDANAIKLVKFIVEFVMNVFNKFF